MVDPQVTMGFNTNMYLVVILLLSDRCQSWWGVILPHPQAQNLRIESGNPAKGPHICPRFMPFRTARTNCNSFTLW